MGAFIHYCIHCSAKLNVDEAWLGKSMKCPACGNIINFPEAENSEDGSFPAFTDSDESSDMPDAPDFSMPEPPENEPKIKLRIADNDLQQANCSSEDTQTEYPEQENSAAAKESNEDLSGKSDTENEKKSSKRAYFWGRLGSASVWLLASVTLISCAYYSWNLYMDYRANEAIIPEKIELATVNKELNDQEKSLSNQFNNAVSLLHGTGVIGKDGVLDGMISGDEIYRQPDPMPLGLLTKRELEKAQQVFEQYKLCNKKLKEEFIKSFGNFMQLKHNSMVTAAALTGGSSRIILRAGELKQRFYTNEQYRKSILDSLESSVRKVKQSMPAATAEQQLIIKRFEAATGFVRKQLFPNDNNETVVRTSHPDSTFSAVKSPEELDIAADLMLQLAEGWQLDSAIADMERLLKKVPVLTSAYEKKKNILLRKMGKEQVNLWLEAILKAFALLVLGDVLRAFFDKADILRRMEGKLL